MREQLPATPAAASRRGGRAKAAEALRTGGERMLALPGAKSAASAEVPGDGGIRQLPLDEIVPNRFQHRRLFDPEKIAEIAASIRRHGLLQAVTVRPWKGADGRPSRMHELVAGEQRWRAYLQLEAEEPGRWRTIAVNVRDVSDTQSRTLALVENTIRSDPGAWETATGILMLQQEIEEERGSRVSLTELCEYLPIKESMISKYLKIGRLITPDVLERAGFVTPAGVLDSARIGTVSVDRLLAAAGQTSADAIAKELATGAVAKVRKAPRASAARAAGPAGRVSPVTPAALNDEEQSVRFLEAAAHPMTDGALERLVASLSQGTASLALERVGRVMHALQSRTAKA